MKLLVALGSAALALGIGSSAFAGVVPGGAPSFSVDISPSGGDTLHRTPTLTLNPDGTYSGQVDESVSQVFSILFDFTLNRDPAISGSFTLRNLSNAEQTFSISATMGVLALGAPTQVSGYFGDLTYSDTHNDGTPGNGLIRVATTLGFPFYRAEIDGAAVHTLGSFDIPIESSSGVTGTISQESFADPNGPAVVGLIGVAFPSFSLTPGDTIQTPFQLVVVPEPAFAPLFALAFVLFFLITREKSSV